MTDLKTSRSEAALAEQALRHLITYPIHSTLEARVSDLDGYGHLNGIRVGLFYEDARARSYGPIGRATRLVVAQFTMRYLAEGTWPGVLVIGTGVSRIGRSSYTLAQALFQRDRCIGTAETVLVRSDGAGAIPLAPDLVDELRASLIA